MERNVASSWNAIINGQDMPKLSMKEDIFFNNITFFEASTNSIAQFTLNNIILRIYGVSDTFVTKMFQYFSLSTSMLSICVSFVKVSYYTLCDTPIIFDKCLTVFRGKFIKDQWSCQKWPNLSKDFVIGYSIGVFLSFIYHAWLLP